MSSRSNIWTYICSREYGVSIVTNKYYRSTLGELTLHAERFLEDKAAGKRSIEVECNLKTRTKSTFAIVFSRDGRRMASLHGDHSVRIIDVSTGDCVQTLIGHPRSPWTAEFHQTHSNILASGCLGGEVRIWDLLSGDCDVWRSPAGNSIASIAMHPTNKLLLIAQANCVYIWTWELSSQPQLYASPRRSCETVRWLKFDNTGSIFYTGITTSVEYDWHILRQPPSVFEVNMHRSTTQTRGASARARNQYQASLNTTVSLEDMLGNPLEISNDLLISQRSHTESHIDIYHAATTYAQLHRIHTGSESATAIHDGPNQEQTTLNIPQNQLDLTSEEGSSQGNSFWLPSRARAAQLTGIFGAALLFQAASESNSISSTSLPASSAGSETASQVVIADLSATQRMISEHYPNTLANTSSSQSQAAFTNNQNGISQSLCDDKSVTASKSTSLSGDASIHRDLSSSALFNGHKRARLSSAASNNLNIELKTEGKPSTSGPTSLKVPYLPKEDSVIARTIAISTPQMKRSSPHQILDIGMHQNLQSVPSNNAPNVVESMHSSQQAPVDTHNGSTNVQESSHWLDVHKLICRLEGFADSRQLRIRIQLEDIITRLERLLLVNELMQRFPSVMKRLHLRCLNALRCDEQTRNPMRSQLFRRMLEAVHRLEDIINHYDQFGNPEVNVLPASSSVLPAASSRHEHLHPVMNGSDSTATNRARPGVTWTRGLRPVQTTQLSAGRESNSQSRNVGHRLHQRDAVMGSLSSDPLLHRSQRIQKWSLKDPPEALDCQDNIIVHKCKIHNDCGVDISKDGQLLAVFVPNPNLAQCPGFYGDDTLLRVISLNEQTLGDVLYQVGLGSNPVSVSISPLSNYVVVGLAGYRMSHDHLAMVMYDTYRLPQRLGHSPKLVKSVKSTQHNDSKGIVNCLKWLPFPGQGIVLGTNQGQIYINHTVSTAPNAHLAHSNRLFL